MTPAEVCKILDIQASTLRKYSLLLEKEGIQFERSKNNSRKYTETHVIALQEATRLMDSTDMTLEKAIHQACKALKASPIVEETKDGNEPLQRHTDDTAAVMLEEIRGLRKEIKERDLLFVEALEKMQNKIDQLEEQLSLPEPEEEGDPKLSYPEPEKKKGFFSRLFK